MLGPIQPDQSNPQLLLARMLGLAPPGGPGGMGNPPMAGGPSLGTGVMAGAPIAGGTAPNMMPGPSVGTGGAPMPAGNPFMPLGPGAKGPKNPLQVMLGIK